MVRKKQSFIDKKNSKTYYITYKPQQGEGDEEEAGGGAAARHPAFDEDPELAELLGMGCGYEDTGYEVGDDKRREILELGLPDDGYDYLRHLREVAPKAGAAPAKNVEVLDLPDDDTTDADGDVSTAGAASSSSTAAAAAAAAVSSVQVVGGPTVFIPAAKAFKAPGEDARLVDARALNVAENVSNDDEADAAASTVSAFTRLAPVAHKHVGMGPGGFSAAPAAPVSAASTATALGLRGRVVTELAELEDSMMQLEKQDVPVGETRSAMEGAEVQGDEEWADWLDEFVVIASAAPEHAATGSGAPGVSKVSKVRRGAHETVEEGDEEEDEEEGEGGLSEDDDEDDEGDDWVGPLAQAVGGGGDGEGGVGRSRRGAGSIASTYWRPDREDRKGELQGLDDHFETLALQYDDDKLGDLDDGDDVEKARGTADISMFAAVLDEFLQNEGDKEHGAHGVPGAIQTLRPVHDEDDDDDDDEEYDSDMDEEQYEAMMARKTQGGMGVITGGANKKMESFDNRDDEVIAATRARLEAAAMTGGVGVGLGPCADVDDQPLPDTFQTVVLDRGERWDCESVLSLRSNLDNHPGRIVEPQKKTGVKGGQRIILSNKTGLPLLAPQRTIPEEGEEGEGSSGDEDGEEEGVQGSVVGGFERSKDETPEEKKARKAACKEARRASRAAKKELKGMFKGEAVKQKKQAAGRSAAGGGVGIGSSTYVIK